MCLPLVTIGIINYNCKKFLENCVQSYLKQSYDNIEIIIADDCSTDGSIEVIKELEKNNERIRGIYHNKNSGGPSQAIQEIIREAKGRYFQWLASDDYVEADEVQKLAEYLEKTGKDYAYCNFKIVNENNIVTSQWRYTLPTLDNMVYRIFTNCSGVIPMNGLYRLEFFRKNNITWIIYRNNDHSCDTINSLNFIMNGMKYGMVNEGLIYYRLHDSNCSHNVEQRIKTSLIVYDYIIKNFNEEIYLPDINWKGSSNREQLKNYTIASFLYTRMIDYVRSGGIPQHIKNNISGEKLKECMHTFIDEGMQYIQLGLTQGNVLHNELIEIEKKYKNFFI
ncbi:glycosyltransferase involved in cell wall biosynthesis [Ruminiclostridium sufflavum DSM 19573]|uniref:Glycosyltransferase involved in cell wall biosynthesis n=1 Tax=Ruminiclostridium sufflavum DSM 19573 TaxID=1121337 RepID=A0A318XIW7_9FIRM|nr:glycosyltransferase family 2 protein [Ruminiclostridium sufflavum]PYG85783.1 glycosyltransferase involved in cell wall biosynthesis [Ruminiclostridium sufflavum DSM 19573]